MFWLSVRIQSNIARKGTLCHSQKACPCSANQASSLWNAIAHIQDGSSHIINLHYPSQTCPEPCVLGDSKSYQADKINHHKPPDFQPPRWWARAHSTGGMHSSRPGPGAQPCTTPRKLHALPLCPCPDAREREHRPTPTSPREYSHQHDHTEKL